MGPDDLCHVSAEAGTSVGSPQMERLGKTLVSVRGPAVFTGWLGRGGVQQSPHLFGHQPICSVPSPPALPTVGNMARRWEMSSSRT